MCEASKVWNPSICSRVARLAVVARMDATWDVDPMVATGSPASTNWPMFTEMRSIPAINT